MHPTFTGSTKSQPWPRRCAWIVICTLPGLAKLEWFGQLVYRPVSVFGFRLGFKLGKSPDVHV